jgi:putative hydrolase of the HAD superfamily
MSTASNTDKVQRTLNGRYIDALTIDFWATIGQDDQMTERRKLRRDLVKRWFARHGVEMSDSEVYDLLQRFAKVWREAWLERQYTPNARDAADWLAAAVKIQPSEEDCDLMAQKIDDTLRSFPPVPVDGAIEAIKELGEHFPLALICDTGLSGGRNIEWLLEEWGIRDLFKTLVFSDAVGVSKPHPKMFDTASEALGVPRQRLVHIGDREDTDVKGAKSFGMAAIRFEGARNEILCGPCSMADVVADRWDEIVAVLLSD